MCGAERIPLVRGFYTQDLSGHCVCHRMIHPTKMMTRDDFTQMWVPAHVTVEDMKFPTENTSGADESRLIT